MGEGTKNLSNGTAVAVDHENHSKEVCPDHNHADRAYCLAIVTAFFRISRSLQRSRGSPSRRYAWT